MAYIWIRRTLDWADEQAFLAQLDVGFEEDLAVWDQAFEMPFHLFRARVKQIAHDNLAEVRGATVVTELGDIPAGALVLPVDDDDWFAPNAAERLAELLSPEATGYVWHASYVESPMWIGHRVYLARRALIPWWRPRWTCSTNNYAVVKRESTRKLLLYHTEASAWVDSAAPGQVVRIADRLSAFNRTIGSKTQLGAGDRDRHSTPTEMRRKLRRYRRRYQSIDLSRITWARPYVERMAALTDELAARD